MLHAQAHMPPRAPEDDVERRRWGDAHGLYPHSPGSTAWAHEPRMAAHLAEYTACIRWAIAQRLQPAVAHKHRAPCDPTQFYYGVAPWLADGTVNPHGVTPGPERGDELDASRRIPDFAGAEAMRPEDERGAWQGARKKEPAAPGMPQALTRGPKGPR